MNNKLVAQMVSGILLFLCYSRAWSYNGGITKESANDLANLELWGGTTPFLMKFLILLPILGIVSIYLSVVKKYSYLYNLSISVVISLILFRTWILINSNAIELGFYLAVMGVVASIYSMVIFKRDLNGEENKELKMATLKLKEIAKKLDKRQS